MKIAIIGAGSSYTPEIIEKLNEMRAELPVRQIVLMDIDGYRLEVMLSFCQRFAARLGMDVDITSTSEASRAIDGASFVITQIRVGGNATRVTDERTAMKYGLIGQETTGAGGFIKAMRTVPAMLRIARDVELYSPNAWIINYSNPTGIVAEAVMKHSKVRIAGLCAGGHYPAWLAELLLGVDKASVRYDYFGLNHLSFAYNMTVGGRKLTQEEFDTLAGAWQDTIVKGELVRKLQMIPSPYLQYYFHTSKKLKAMSEAKLTRGEEVQLLEKEVFSVYADERQSEKPEALAKRGGGGYSDIAIGAIDAIHNNRDKWMVVNVPNNGSVKWLPDDAVIETGCLVNSAGIAPMVHGSIPSTVWGLIAAVKNFEQLAVEAAVTGCRDTALMALLAHPLVKDYDIAKPLLDDLLETNKTFLPQFFQ